MHQVSCIRTRKRHAFTTVRRHIQSIIPVRATQANMVVLSDLIKSTQHLQQQMLQHGSFINFPVLVFLPYAIRAVPMRIQPTAPLYLLVFKIYSLFP